MCRFLIDLSVSHTCGEKTIAILKFSKSRPGPMGSLDNGTFHYVPMWWTLQEMVNKLMDLWYFSSDITPFFLWNKYGMSLYKTFRLLILVSYIYFTFVQHTKNIDSTNDKRKRRIRGRRMKVICIFSIRSSRSNQFTTTSIFFEQLAIFFFRWCRSLWLMNVFVWISVLAEVGRAVKREGNTIMPIICANHRRGETLGSNSLFMHWTRSPD